MVPKDIREEAHDSLFTDEIRSILLKDNTTGSNIVWATDDYQKSDKSQNLDMFFLPNAEIDVVSSKIIKPRHQKKKEDQTQRSKSKAEVFTPYWVCLEQNDLIDEAWVGSTKGCSFVKIGKNKDKAKEPNGWRKNSDKIFFPNTEGKTWLDYVKANRLEITCGEAPYLTSIYDVINGDDITVGKRIGLLDRKLRVVTENTTTKEEWIEYAKIAVQSVYGFDWQGDNVFLARQNILFDVIDYYLEAFDKEKLPMDAVKKFAEIISWNIFQMDGLKFVLPNTCHREESGQLNFLDGGKTEECPGCKKGDKFLHNGIYANTMDWEEKKIIRFVDILKEE